MGQSKNGRRRRSLENAIVVMVVLLFLQNPEARQSRRWVLKRALVVWKIVPFFGLISGIGVHLPPLLYSQVSANRVRTTAFKKSQCHDFSSLSAPFSTFRTEYGVDFVGLSLFRHGLRSAYPIRKAHCTCYESLSIEIRNSNISAT